MVGEAVSSSLLTELKSADLRSIHGRIDGHLRRHFKPLLSQNPNPKTIPIIRDLAKQHISFLTGALSLIPERLSNSSSPIDPSVETDLFESYKLCIRCLQCISSQLDCKPYMMHLQRLRLLQCYEGRGRYDEAVSLLGDLRKEGRFVPVLGKDGTAVEHVLLVVAVAGMIVKCVYMKECKDDDDYRNVMVLVDEVTPWFRVLDASAYEKYHTRLVTYLIKCTILLVEKVSSTNKNLVREFLSVTFAECRKSSMKDQLHKYAAKICSSLFTSQDCQPSLIMNIVSYILDNVAAECKVDNESNIIELLELVSYCAYKCRIAKKHLCSDLATHIKKLGGDLHQADLILRLYSTGLFLTGKDVNSESKLEFWRDKDVEFPDLSVLVGRYKTNSLASGVCKVKNENIYLLPSYYAMIFVYKPLAEVVNSARSEIFSQTEDDNFKRLGTIRDALLQFCVVFLFCHRVFDQDSIPCDDYNRTMPGVAVAALSLSFRTNFNIEESENIITQVISADWIQVTGLKFLCAYIYNVGVTLFRSKQLKEAAMALELCCRAAWACVSTFLPSLKSSNDVPEYDNFVNEACAKSAFLLDLLYQCSDHDKAKEVVRSSLEKWSEVAVVFKNLSSPLALVKQWVKIECKLFTGPDIDGAVSLFSLLSSCTKVSRESLGVILEQELSSYNDMRALNSKLCHKMQTDIVDVLLAEVYVTDTDDDFCFHRSKILIAKGRNLRASDFKELNACIECLSEAIFLLGKSGVSNETSHHLAVAYALRALCKQEAEPSSKNSFEDIHADIRAAIKLWHRCDTIYENVLILLYHVIDMLSLKGYTEFYSDIYKLLLRLYKQKEIPLHKCMALLWQCRRLSHALCPSPLNEAFNSTLQKQGVEPFWENCLCGSLPFGGSHILKTKLDDVKQDPLSSDSAFLAAHLYFDLSEKMICYGRLREALSFAKESHHIRCKLLQEKFKYSTSHQSNGETFQKRRYTYSYCQVHNSVATTAWPQDRKLFNFESTVLTPWNVLRCYLESTLQVGIIHELMGDGSEAESLLLLGKSMANLNGLPVFEIAFSSVLGRVYRKQQLWDQAEKELQSAKVPHQVDCSKCRLLMEVTIMLEFGDLYRIRRDGNIGNHYLERLNAEKLYKSAIDKLNCSEWKNSLSNPTELRDENAISHDNPTNKVQNRVDVAETKTKRPRTTKNSAKTLPHGQSSTAMQNQRMTRSKTRRQTNNENDPCEEAQVVLTEQKVSTEMSCICNTNKCWYCLPDEVMHKRSLDEFVQMKWEFARRQLLLKLLSGLGKCMDACGETHKSHEQLVQSIYVLVGRNSFPETSFVHPNFLLTLIGKDISEDAFAIEHAALLYNICWFSLKSYPCKGSRASCCDMANIPIPDIVSWLMLSFVLSREVPVLFRKVSRLLAVVFMLSASTELFSKPGSLCKTLTELFPEPVFLCKTLSESHWASYFHQASIGTHVNYQGGSLTNSRLVPERFQDLGKHVLNFFHDFPCATIIAISLLGDSFSSLFSRAYSARAWLLLSRLTSNRQPIVLLQPLDSILSGLDVVTVSKTSNDDTNVCSGVLSEDKEVTKSWHSPWGSTVVDEIVPAFRLILEKTYMSSIYLPQEDTEHNRFLWWKQRKDLDQQLGKLTRDLEDLWLGPWKHLLLGEWSGCNNRQPVLKKLARDLIAKCKVKAPESLLKANLEGAKLACLREECILQLIKNEGCFVGGMDNQESHKALAERVLKLILEATIEAEEEDLNREPVILVLDHDIQMLPWESLPILRNQEVYRMPSMRSIFTTLDKCHGQVGKEPVAFPMIDPLDAYYLLNPSGDLIHTQTEFEDWFRVQNLKGKAGISPTVDELLSVLSSRDLYIYIGHGSGAQYIPGHEIQKLENCAATLLMGCSSGSLSLNGCYAPKGAPLSYLLAGSPVIIANLWDVTDKDIDRFSKAMLKNWLGERAAVSSDDVKCKKCTVPIYCCSHRPKIGSFVGQARDACTLPFLIGAAPVCYGVPTCISKKKKVYTGSNSE